MTLARHLGKAVRLIAVAILVAVAAAPAAAAALDAQTRQALSEAINDEYQARALYQAVIAKVGGIRPFVNIVQAEIQHAEELRALFVAYKLPVPADTYAGKAQAPATIQEACKVAVQAETKNVAMYGRFLMFVKEPDIVAVFTRLRDASADRHLPAFQRCAR
ncbi:MAG: DUF2202 domain-containing protein [bacterium]|nr:DUF2202 domain-containing protein [bacterium]